MEFRILGPLEVLDDGRPLDLGGARQRALLAILLLHRGEIVSADRLIEELYGTTAPATAAKSLQAHVSRLRKVLGGDGRVQTRSRGYVLVLDGDDVDADRFVELVTSGRSALGRDEPDRAAESLGTALGLWRGTPLVDLAYESFAQAEIGRLEELRIGCLEERLEADLALGRHAAVVGELEGLVAEHPLRERLRVQLMLALYRCGRQAEALEAYQQGRRALVDGLGIDPGRALQELERAILVQDPALDPVARQEATQTAAPTMVDRLAGSRFVGRAHELSLLELALADARAGRGGLVLLGGEAGIGKSRLSDELATRARALGVRVLWGRCWEAGGAPAYWPWVQALRSYVRESDPEALRLRLGNGAAELAHLLPEVRALYPDVPEQPALDSDGARFKLFDSTAAFLRNVAAEQPLLVILDDVHAADASSLLMLEFVTAELADARVLVLAAYRDPELDPGDPTAAALAGLGRHARSRISLAGLREPEVASFIESSGGVEPSQSLVAAIAAETEGNPLFVGEIVRMLAGENRLTERADATWRPSIPETVKDVIGRRLDRLSTECRGTLALASVVGREFPLDVLERLAELSAGELLALLDEAIAARLVTDVPGSPGRLRFTHALVRDTLFDGLSHGRRLELHRRTGEALEALGGADGRNLSELAHHFFQALPDVDAAVAVRYAKLAAEQARLLLAHEEAARLYETALQALQLRKPVDQELERALLLGLADALARSGEMPSAKDAFLRAAALARMTGAPEDLAAAALGYGGRIVWARAAGDVLIVSLLEEALVALGDEDTALRARVLARLAGARRDDREPDRRVALGQQAVEIARRVGDPAAVSFALTGLAGAIHGIGDTASRLAVITDLLAAAVAAGDKEGECEGLMTLMLVHAERNEMTTIRELLARIAALAEELRQPSQQWFAAATTSMLAVHDGRFDEAEKLIPAALEIGGNAQTAEAAGPHAIQLFILRREQGRAGEAHEALARLAVEFPARPFFRTALATLCSGEGRAAEARRLFEAVAPNRFEAMPRDNEWLLAAHFLGETCCAFGDTTRAAQLYEELEPIAAKGAANVPEGAVGTLARAVAGLAELLGRDDEAIRLFELAIELDGANGARPWAAHAQVDLARIADRIGEHERAASLLVEASATTAELGMVALGARITAARS